MRVHVRHIFERFQNLNLAFLIEDLRRNLAAVGNWQSDVKLCPVAHAMPDGTAVAQLRYLSQEANLMRACEYAAAQLGARPTDVLHFVERWDDGCCVDWLLRELEMIWSERRDDALVMQELLAPVVTAR